MLRAQASYASREMSADGKFSLYSFTLGAFTFAFALFFLVVGGFGAGVI